MKKLTNFTRLSQRQVREIADGFRPKEKQWFKKVDIWLSTIPAILGLILSGIAIYQAKLISDQETTIKGFGTLLQNQRLLNIETATLIKKATVQLGLTSTTNKLVNDQLGVLNKQLALNTASQGQANKNAEYVKTSNRNRLFVATVNLRNMVEESRQAWLLKRMDSTKIEHFLNEFKAILEGELQNPYLLQNQKLTEYWLNANQSVLSFQFNNPVNSFMHAPEIPPNYNGPPLGHVETTEADRKKFDVGEFKACVKNINATVGLVGEFLRKDRYPDMPRFYNDNF
jgi:hypothetical protein